MRTIIDFACATALVLSQVALTAPALAQEQPQSRDARFQNNGGWGNNNGNGYGNNSGWNGGNNSGQTVRCESRRNNYVECRVDTRGGVRINRLIGGSCDQNRSWGWRDGLIWVDKGCRAEFQTGSFGGNGGWNGGNGGGQGNIVRCESWNFQYAECRADTRGGVRVSRVIGGSCPEGRNWGTRGNVIWVNNGCRADFQLMGGNGNNNNNNNNSNDGGSNTALIIGGVAVAAGLAALLASGSKKPPATPPANSSAGGTTPPPATTQPAPPPANGGRPARINVPTGGVTPDARPSLTVCLNEIARQIGASGGTEIGLDRFDEVVAGNGGFRFRMVLTGVYPDETRMIPTFCRATSTQVIELTFG